MTILKGQLDAVDVPNTGTLTQVYLVPASKVASVNLTIANRTNSSTVIRVAHIKAGGVGAVANGDYLLYDFPTSALAHNLAPISITGIMMGAADTLAVYSNGNAVSAQVNGIEDDV